MAQLNFGGSLENVVTREEFSLEKAQDILQDEVIAIIGYGVQGPGHSVAAHPEAHLRRSFHHRGGYDWPLLRRQPSADHRTDVPGPVAHIRPRGPSLGGCALPCDYPTAFNQTGRVQWF